MLGNAECISLSSSVVVSQIAPHLAPSFSSILVLIRLIVQMVTAILVS
jgi:hypothetical protein